MTNTYLQPKDSNKTLTDKQKKFLDCLIETNGNICFRRIHAAQSKGCTQLPCQKVHATLTKAQHMLLNGVSRGNINGKCNPHGWSNPIVGRVIRGV